MAVGKIVAKAWSRVRSGAARNRIGTIALAAFGGWFVASAVRNYERFGLQGVIWATLFVTVFAVIALYQYADDPEDWPKRN